MIIKWLNGLVVFVLLLIVFVNKDHFVTDAKEPIGDLDSREAVSNEYVKESSLVINSFLDDGEVVLENINKEESDVEPESNKESKVIVYRFQILPGMGSKEVSKVLYDFGLTEEKMEYSSYLMERGFAKRIQIGSFEITDGMTFKDITEIITSK